MKILVLGGASQIGVAIAKRAAKGSPSTAILAARPGSSHIEQAVAHFEASSIEVETIDFDATDIASHPKVIWEAFKTRVDLAVVAFGVLGDEETWRDHSETVQLAQVNFTAALSVGALLAEAMNTQEKIAGSRGKIVAISSVAGERVRRSNFVYGATKAGMDAYYRKLGDALGDEIQVLVVRPGVVSTRMVSGHKQVPLTSSPEHVADRVVDALKKNKRMIRVPRIFGAVMAVFKLIPDAIARRFGL